LNKSNHSDKAQANKAQFAKRELWLSSAYAQQILSTEIDHLKSGLRQVSGPRVLQVGRIIDQSIVDQVDFPQLVITDETSNDHQSSMIADPSFMPLDESSVASVLLPHVLEGHELPHQVIREAHRVLMPEGHVIITGFNPLSLIGLQRFIHRSAAYPGQYYTFKRVVDWLKLLGFEVVTSRMFQYAPLSKNQKIIKALSFLNSIGDRCFPIFGGGYMIVAKKRITGTTMVGKMQFSKQKRTKLQAATAAKTTLNKTNVG